LELERNAEAKIVQGYIGGLKVSATAKSSSTFVSSKITELFN